MAVSWNLRHPFLWGAGTGQEELGQLGSEPPTQPRDLRARIRYVEVQGVAEVAALGASVHRELVHVQVERQRHGGPQHHQSGRDTTETRELRHPVPRGTAVGSRRHRPPPRTLLTRDQET